MADLVFVGILVAFLALCGLYVHACERLIASSDDDSTKVEA